MISFPSHAPFTNEQQKLLAQSLSGLDLAQRAWLSGFLANFEETATERNILVLYGTESGNSEQLAEVLLKQAKKQGHKARLANMSDVEPADLTKHDTILVVVSTWGDGEPPEAAEAFYATLMNQQLDLAGASFSVCALGDTSYEKFCQTGKDIDARLESFGAVRLLDRVDCDVDFEDPFAEWSGKLWKSLGESTASSQTTVANSSVEAIEYGRKNPFPAEVLENILLSGDNSAKETIHLELSLDGSGFDYQPGDVLAVIPRNASDVVEAVLRATGLAADTKIELKGIGELTLLEALTKQLDITGLSRKIVTQWQSLTSSEKLADLLSDEKKEAFKEWANGREIIDLLTEFPAADLTAADFVRVLRKLPPRLYSIASSPVAHPGEVHLTVAAVRYHTHGRDRKGVASTYLADDAKVGENVSVYLHPNKNFRLPENPTTPIIMVGPGTGIAPFRAFIEHRGEDAGDTWLFFGDQCYNEDFLYQTEWQDHLKSGALTRLNLAFSRDQPEKVYVQHQMEKHAADLWKWLEDGAHFYVCGDASRMAKDVHETLANIVKTQGGIEDPEAWLADLKKQKRYQRDVY